MFFINFLFIFSLISLCFQILVAFTGTTPSLNASNILIPSQINVEQSPSPSPSPSPSSHLFKDVLKVISERQSWNLDEIRVSNVDVRNVNVGGSQKYEFRIRIGKSELVFRFSEEVASWKKLRKKGKFGSLINEFSSNTVLNKLELDGPFELRVHGDEKMSLQLPLNTTHTGLKRLLVGEGITVEVKGAREVSLFHASDFGLPVNKSIEFNKDRSQFWPLRQTLCMPLPPIQILGSASLVAYRTRNPNAHIQTAFLSQDMIELLPEKCYTSYPNKKQPCPIDSLNPRLALLEKLMRGFLGDRILQNGFSRFLKVRITASALVRFQLEVERNIGDNDRFWGTLAEWRTKPTAERVRFEVVARVEAERLKPLVVKKVRAFIAANSAAWSTLMSNMSFTKFPSVLVPLEALTLDVRW